MTPRATATSSQNAHPMADYCAKTLKYKRMALIADDIAYGHEMLAGFQRVFEPGAAPVTCKLRVEHLAQPVNDDRLPNLRQDAIVDFFIIRRRLRHPRQPTPAQTHDLGRLETQDFKTRDRKSPFPRTNNQFQISNPLCQTY